MVEAVEPLSQSTRREEIPAAQLDPPLEMPPAGDLKAPVERLGSQRLEPQVCVCVCVESLRERERDRETQREGEREREGEIPEVDCHLTSGAAVVEGRLQGPCAER